MSTEQLDDLFDARAEIRRLKKAVAETGAAYSEAKSDLKEASARSEEILVQLEHRQGRLQFGEEEVAPTPKKKKGRPRKQASEAAAAKHAG
jgi:hypothetical protein